MSSSAVIGRSSAERLRVARHEAGHAVVARAMGRRVYRAAIDQLWDGREGYGGFVRHSDAPRNRETLRDELAILLAGEVAERLATDEEWWLVDPQAALEREAGSHMSPDGYGSGKRYDDWLFVAMRLLAEPDAGRAREWLDEQLEGARRDAAEAIGHYWRSFENLAERLLVDGEVNLEHWRPQP